MVLFRKKRRARPLSNRTARQRKVMIHKTLERKRQHKLKREKLIKQARLSKLKKKKVTCIEKIKKENRVYLNLKRKYFDAILSGIKTEEYRDKTPYYWARIGCKISTLEYIWFINGMSKQSDHMLIKFERLIDDDHKYVLKLGDIVSTDRHEIRAMMI